MITPSQLFRAFRILITLAAYTLTHSLVGTRSKKWRAISFLNPFKWFVRPRSRGESLRLALEKLGPIFVKFGQMLSVRNDFFADDIVIELERLQDQVAPFSEKRLIQNMLVAVKVRKPKVLIEPIVNSTFFSLWVSSDQRKGSKVRELLGVSC